MTFTQLLISMKRCIVYMDNNSTIIIYKELFALCLFTYEIFGYNFAIFK